MHVGAAVEESLHGGRTTGADGAVQGRDAALVDHIRVGACGDETRDRCGLRIRIPGGGTGPAIGSVMYRLRTAPVSCTNVGALGDQLRGNLLLVRRGGH